MYVIDVFGLLTLWIQILNIERYFIYYMYKCITIIWPPRISIGWFHFRWGRIKYSAMAMKLSGFSDVCHILCSIFTYDLEYWNTFSKKEILVLEKAFTIITFMFVTKIYVCLKITSRKHKFLQLSSFTL